MMQIVNAEEIQKFKDLLAVNEVGNAVGSRFFVHEEPKHYMKTWLYSFVKQTLTREVPEMLKEENKNHRMIEKVMQEFTYGHPLTRKGHL